MIKFIYEDQRYKSAGNTPRRTRAALFIMLDFIVGKILESMTWVLTAALAYILFAVFYSNMVLFGSLSQIEEGLRQIAYTLAFLLTAAVFSMFAILLFAYVLASFLTFFPPPSSLGNLPPSKTLEAIKRQKLYFHINKFYLYVKIVAHNFGHSFSWKTRGGNRNQILLIVFSIIAFYNAWSTVQFSGLRDYEYHFLPDFLILTSRDIYDSTYPYVTLIVDHMIDFSVLITEFIKTNIGKIFTQ